MTLRTHTRVPLYPIITPGYNPFYYNTTPPYKTTAPADYFPHGGAAAMPDTEKRRCFHRHSHKSTVFIFAIIILPFGSSRLLLYDSAARTLHSAQTALLAFLLIDNISRIAGADSACRTAGSTGAARDTFLGNSEHNSFPLNIIRTHSKIRSALLPDLLIIR